MKTMRWDIRINVHYCCSLVDGKYVQCSVHWTRSCLAETTGLYLHSRLSRHCYSPVMFSPVCVYTVCNTIVIIHFIHKALGLNEPVLHLLPVENELYITTGYQMAVSTGCAIFTPSSLCITAQEDWQLTQYVPCQHGREEKRVFLTWQQAQHCWLRGTNLISSLMCSLWASHALYCCSVFWGKTSLNCIWKPFKCGSVS